MSNPQKGSVLVMLAAMITVLFAFGAIALDISYYFLVRGQLQNAADAGALAAAGALYPGDSAGNPNWAAAQAKALAIVKSNRVDGNLLTDGTVQNGFWDLNGSVTSVQTTAGTGTSWAPAVTVIVAKAAGKNGGPINTLFGGIIGVKNLDVSASATATLPSPVSVPAGALFPLALPLDLYETYWDSARSAPKIDPSTGTPYVFQISDVGDKGQWTSFNSNSNNVSTIQNLISSGNPIGYSIGDSIWIQPGVKNSIYSSIPSNIDAILPIVSSTSSKSFVPILGYGAVRIYKGVGGSGKYVEASLIPDYTFKYATTGVGGANYGVHLPPSIVY